MRVKGSRAAQGSGNIRKRADGTWEARFTVGRDPGTGKQMQRSVYGKTKTEVRKKLAQAIAAIDSGTYFEAAKLNLAQWLDLWLETYVQDSVKPYTLKSYQTQVKNHIKPALGNIKLSALSTPMIQAFYNSLKSKLSAKTVKNIHGVLHKALQKATELRYIQFNPADACALPRIERKEIKPLDEKQMTAFLAQVEEDPFKNLFLVTLFTGLREGEVLGLSWDCIDFEAGVIVVDKQLQREKKPEGEYYLATPKNGKRRTLHPAPFVMDVLREEKRLQAERQIMAGKAWGNKWNLVFTDVMGKHLALHTVYKHFKQAAAKIGAPEARFHDLRHTYAATALQAGDDIKTVQENLGHATASFTLDVYGHVTDRMKKSSADRMQRFIQTIKQA